MVTDKLNNVPVGVKVKVSIKVSQTGMFKTIESCQLSTKSIKNEIQRFDNNINIYTYNCNNEFTLLHKEINSVKELNKFKLECNSLQQNTKRGCINLIAIPFSKNKNLFIRPYN